MVVSNLRHFTLQVGLVSANGQPATSSAEDMYVRADLIYENGLPVRRAPRWRACAGLRSRAVGLAACDAQVEQLATSEPVLVGKTELKLSNGQATFKLRITSLSSHRDRQRFRIRVTASDQRLLAQEPGLSVVTHPMKCVTKLAHRPPPSPHHRQEGHALDPPYLPQGAEGAQGLAAALGDPGSGNLEDAATPPAPHKAAGHGSPPHAGGHQDQHAMTHMSNGVSDQAEPPPPDSKRARLSTSLATDLDRSSAVECSLELSTAAHDRCLRDLRAMQAQIIGELDSLKRSMARFAATAPRAQARG